MASPAQPLPESLNDMSQELVPIATFVTAAEAAAARFALEAEGITCFLKDDHVVGMYSIAANGLGYVKLLVPTANAEQARSLLDTPFDDWPSFTQSGVNRCRQCGEDIQRHDETCRHCGAPYRASSPTPGSKEAAAFVQTLVNDHDELRHQADNPYAPPRAMADDADATEDEDEMAFDNTDGRARCPDCGRSRVAVCPFCKTNSSRFRVADMIDGHQGDADPALLICSICDEPFEPSYLRRCEWCGHEFADGIDPPPIVRTSPAEPLNARVLLVGLAGVAIVVGLFAYFAMLLS